MMNFPENIGFIDIHVHHPVNDPSILQVVSLFPENTGSLLKRDKNLLFSAGIHPWYAERYGKDVMGQLKQALSDPDFIAVGETGLDRLCGTDPGVQMNFFRQHIELSGKLQKPMIIHCVRAYNEIMEERMKSRSRLPWIIHRFNGSYEMAMRLIEKGFYLSFGDLLLNRNTRAAKIFAEIPPERIFFETDDFGLTICDIYNQAIQLKNMLISELHSRVVTNFNNCFASS